MQAVINTLQNRKEQLDQSLFCQTLIKKDIPAESRLSFIPDMVYFVMGFKDMLMALEDRSSEEKWQKAVNQHVLEDNTHWQWYLKDLETLHQSLFKVDLSPGYIWRDSNWPIRDLVYETMSAIKSIESPFLKMTVIQVLEATFDTFNEFMSQPINELKLFKNLIYFGQGHLDAEEGHTFEEWLETDPQKVAEDFKEFEQEYPQAIELINRLYDAFEGMFGRWHELQTQTMSMPAFRI